MIQHARRAPAVSRLVEVQLNRVAGEINDVGGSRAIDVRQLNAPPVKQVRPVESGRMVHRDLGAESPVAEVRPIAHFAVADANQIGKAVAGHIRQKNGLGAV